MSQFEGIEVLDYSGPNYKALTALFRRQARGHEEKEVPVFAIMRRSRSSTVTWQVSGFRHRRKTAIMN
jgi:hypothetical protein